MDVGFRTMKMVLHCTQWGLIPRKSIRESLLWGMGSSTVILSHVLTEENYCAYYHSSFPPHGSSSFVLADSMYVM